MPSLDVVDATRRVGSNTARNVGAKHARGDFLLFIDADDEVDPGWLRAMAGSRRGPPTR